MKKNIYYYSLIPALAFLLSRIIVYFLYYFNASNELVKMYHLVSIASFFGIYASILILSSFLWKRIRNIKIIFFVTALALVFDVFYNGYKENKQNNKKTNKISLEIK